MLEPAQVIGAVVFTIMGVLSHVLHNMPRHAKVLPYLFPRSGRTRSKAFGYLTGFALPLFLASWGAAVTGNYQDARLLLLFAGISASFGVWHGLVILTTKARAAWTTVSSVCIFGVLYAFSLLICPTTTIVPRAAVFAEADINSPRFFETISFLFENKTEDELYSAGFKLRENIKDDVPVIFYPDPYRDIARFICTDSEGRRVFLGWLRHIGPKESVQIIVTQKASTLKYGRQVSFTASTSTFRDVSQVQQVFQPGMKFQDMMWDSEQMSQCSMIPPGLR